MNRTVLMKIWRVEDATGVGPYDQRRGVAREEERNNWAGTHPAPENDGIRNYALDKSRHIFGFRTLEQAEAWFASWRPRLRRRGFFLSIYLCPREDVLIGGRQVAFDKYEARLFGTREF